ncbi:capsular biosynthesis protein [Roseomonas sp. NAR14]|uniref:Capsular biosynthesis protein n=1 Tax=Roseomonas acroporae TaxID=2937791 RepID=A0A9X2BV75_9PROT|nr:capsular biosynthesis protein [Roseomonas acroporae]MCK8786372.1 capsular biosynthesis protein [Roseomonas acroporae]
MSALPPGPPGTAPAPAPAPVPAPPGASAGAWLILSSAYVGQELAAEFGPLPPCMLPVGNSRLYELQLERIAAHRAARWPVHLTLPEDYRLPGEDARRLEAAGVVVVPVPPGLPLGEAVVYAVNYIGLPDQPLRILHGDTLLRDLPAGPQDPPTDLIAVAAGGDEYSWAEAELAEGLVRRLETAGPGRGDARRPIACGYFAFRSATALVRDITRARYDFIEGINLYAARHAVRAATAGAWFDFGHLQTYFHSRRAVTTARHFNALRIDGLTARKSSADRDKMRAEAAWLGGLPAPLRLYGARLLDSGGDEAGGEAGRAWYETEYEHMPALSELYVFGALGRPGWLRILDSCADFLALCAASRRPGAAPGSGDAVLAELAGRKTLRRLARFARESGFDIDHPMRLDGRPLPSLAAIAESLAALAETRDGRAECVMHGDFCFSNILWNARARRIRLIDPRGHVRPGHPGLHGDLRYDLAKLAHSILGRYDLILAGRYRLEAPSPHDLAIRFEPAPHQAWLEEAFADLSVDGVHAAGPAVRAAMTGLFLSMLPLHADRPDRQRAFIANALRLYAALERVPA